MSDTRTMAALTGTLTARIQGLLATAGLSGFAVSATHPSGDPPDPGVYVCLFRAMPHAQLGNDDLPVRTPGGALSRRPKLALAVQYLLSFVGDASVFAAERLAGLVMTDLHSNPMVAPSEIRAWLATLDADHPLVGTTFPEEVDAVRLTLVAEDVEQLARIWGLFNQSFYALSVVYEASALRLEPDVQVGAAPPVAQVRAVARSGAAPRIDAAGSVDTLQPLLPLGQTLRITGASLRGDETLVRIGDTLVAPLSATDTEIRVVPTGAAGVTTVSVVHRTTLDDGSTREAGESSRWPIALLPVVGTPTWSAGVLRVPVSPLPGADQRVEVLLNRVGGGSAGGSAPTVDGADLLFMLGTLSPGTWRVRVVVDGAASLPTLGADGTWAGPDVVVP